MMPDYIRPIAICIIRRDDAILVFEGYDHIKQQTFYRPLGGGIDFSEYSIDALQREFHEELNAELVNLRYLQTTENIFTLEGKTGHEIVFIYAGEFADPAFYEKDEILGLEDNGDTFKAFWMPLDEFRSGKHPLYPTELLALLGDKKP